MFDDKPISYDWQEPLDAAFEYSVPPTSNYATVMKSFPTSRNYKMTIHARMRHETYYDDGMKFTPKPTSHAYSYGEKEICTGD